MSQERDRDVFLGVLQNIADGVTERVGFELAAISVALDERVLETVAVSGDPAVRAQLAGHRLPVPQIENELLAARELGSLRFIPHEEMTIPEEEMGFVPDLEITDDPDRWHPLDVLLAPIRDDDGVLRGLLSVDLPRDGRRPREGEYCALERYVRQTRRAVLTAVERVQLAEQVRVADTARLIVREVRSELSTDRILELASPALTSAFGAQGLWLQSFDPDGEPTDTIYGSTRHTHLPDELKALGQQAARTLWATQQVVAVGASLPSTGVLPVEEERLVLDHLAVLSATAMLVVPLGAGRECFGILAMTRRGGPPDWTSVEKRAALEIGHDLGRALLNAQTFEREQRLVAELRELDGYKGRLIATLAHELKNPLTAVLGHVEILEGNPNLDSRLTRPVAAMGRSAVRMQRLIEDLLVLSRVEDPDDEAEPAPVDLRPAVEDVLDLLRVTITGKELDVVVDAPATPVLALADAAGVDRICANLVSNAVKYTEHGGRVTITLDAGPEWVRLAVADTGMGISAADQERLFTEFFRSTNPAAVALPGTGLGLAIVRRIVERHAGTITVDSTPGEGTTFTVRLPRANPEPLVPSQKPLRPGTALTALRSGPA